MKHKILPPFKGYYIALYCRRTSEGDDQYLGYFKVFPEQPSDYWDEGHVAKKCLGGVANSSQAAMEYAEELAKLCILSLPTAAERRRNPGALRANAAAALVKSALCAACEFGERSAEGSKCTSGARCESSVGLMSRRI